MPIGEYGGGMSSRGLYDYVYSFLKQKQVNVIDYGPADIDNFVGFIRNNVQNIICPHYFNGIHLLDDVRIFKIVYGVPRNEQAQFDFTTNYLFDYIITFGEEASERFKMKGYKNLFYAGNPMFDNWFNSHLDTNLLNMIETRVKKEMPTILYLPTYNTYSSIDAYADEIIKLRFDYNILIKLHHGTFNGEIDRLCKFMSYSEIQVFGDYMDPLILYKVSDVVLTDGVSGSTFDSLLIGKPTIALGLFPLSEYGIDIINGDESLQTINIPYITNPENISTEISRNIGKKVKLNDWLMEKFFYRLDGNAGQRIAEGISKRSISPPRPTLEKHEMALKVASDPEQRAFVENAKMQFLRYHYVEPKQQNRGFFSRLLRRASKKVF